MVSMPARDFTVEPATFCGRPASLRCVPGEPQRANGALSQAACGYSAEVGLEKPCAIAVG
jgi:hypothetical protein